ncbi:hypothetical protein BDZ45DRAFT_681952 [Acephala macrosclerotiorum]|nr:hypothetical protein BDZ45DRAFT_681952 [Acephala macrosclerotiorum]
MINLQPLRRRDEIPSAHLTTMESWFITSISAAALGLILTTFRSDGEPLLALVALSTLGFAATFCLIKWAGPTFLAIGLSGEDMSKRQRKTIPEGMGVISGVVFCMVSCLFLAFGPYLLERNITRTVGDQIVTSKVEFIPNTGAFYRFPQAEILTYYSSIISLLVILLLGIGDDVFDLRWRHKIFIPILGIMPTQAAYFMRGGGTTAVIPTPLQPWFGPTVDLGTFYYVFMIGVSIFMTNSINILAGVNGIEVSQSLAIAFLLVFNDALYLFWPNTNPGIYPNPTIEAHLFSIYILLPFIGVSLALAWHNWFPAKVFVGDSYCYFAGMVFAVVGIFGHFSKTILLLTIPQLANFVYSLPQLAKIVPCPRHRLPHFNARTGLMEPSMTIWDNQGPKPLISFVLKTLDRLYLLRIKTNEEGQITESSNFTILNLWLVWFGPRREDRLVMDIVGLQLVCGLLGLLVRHKLAGFIFEFDNLMTARALGVRV